MEELFPNISNKLRKEVEMMADLTLGVLPLPIAAEKLANFASLFEGEEAEFVDFYFNLRMEQFKNEG